MKITSAFFASTLLLGVLSLFFNSIGVFICGFIGLLLISKVAGIDKKEISKYIGFVFVISVLFMILHYYGLIEAFGKPYYGTDDERFEAAAQQLVDQNVYLLKDMPYIAGMYYAKGYCLVIAYIIRICRIFGGDYCTVAPRILNICLWIATCILVYKLLKNKTNTLFAKKVFLVLALFPNALYISSFVYRDTLVAFLVTLFVYLLLDLFNQENCRNNKHIVTKLLLICWIVYFMIYIRMQMLFIMGLFVVLFAFSKFLPNTASKYIGYSLAGIICFTFLAYFGGTEWIGDFSDQYTAYRTSQVTGLSRFIFTIPMLPFGIILRMIYGLCVPFPAEILSLDLSTPLYSFIRLMICLGTIFQIFFIPYLIRKIPKLENESLVFAAVYISIIATTFTFRHFLLCYPFLALTMGEGYYETDRATRKQYLVLMLAALIILAAVYAIIVVF